MENAVEVHRIDSSRWGVYSADKLLDTATTEMDAQILKGKIKSHMANEDLAKERDKLQRALTCANEVIAGYHHRIDEINKLTSTSATAKILKGRTL